jgi:hypothetical protein
MGPIKGNFEAIIVQLLVLITLSTVSQAQSASEKRKIFIQAETYLLYEEYELANPLFLQLESPNNMNIKYKIGSCYLNIPGEKEKAVPYLEDAIKDASYSAKTDNFKEKKAPLDAYFSLAKAYMINNEFDKALKTLDNFKRLVYDPSLGQNMKNLGYIDQQVQACRNAITMKERPVIFNKELLGGAFSLGAINDNAAVSFDGNTIVYTEHRGMANAIFYARKTDDKWQDPVDITRVIGAGDDCSTCSLNNDGTEIFLYKNDNWDGAIYSTEFRNGAWTQIKKLNRNINTKYYESHASISADGKRLYFTSNREGGFGNLDIYVSGKDENGDWGPAENLGASVNTPFNEDTPFMTENDSILYFSSEGHSSMGGYDIFRSRRSGNGWEIPLNMGFPLNTSDDDKFFQPWQNDKKAYYSLTTGYKKKEIFVLDFTGPEKPLYAEITGKISLSDTVMTFDKTFRVHLIDRVKGDTVDTSYPNKFTGNYSFTAAPGRYRLVYTGLGYLTHTIDTAILKENKQALNLDIALVRDPSMKNMPRKYDKLNFNEIPIVSSVDSTILIKNLHVNDVNDKNIDDSKILYYTVQVMALYNPVDMNYFKFVPDIKVMYNDQDKFYRYTTGIFQSREQAIEWKADLLRRGYPDDIFIKKVSK